MNDIYLILKEINWFLEPISNFLLFLFTTASGISILIGGFIAFIVFSVINSLRIRQLAHAAAQNNNKARTPFMEQIYIIADEIVKIFGKIIANLPVLLIVFILLAFLVGMSNGFKSMDDFLANQQKIKELKSVLKQLDKRYKVAEIKALEVNETINTSVLEIRYFDAATGKYTQKPQQIMLKGSDIYFDALVLNFDFSEIEAGSKRNIVLPYRIFSELIPQSEGIPLALTDTSDVPYIFNKAESEVYGMEANKYKEHVQELMSYFTDKEKAQKAGIRSTYGNAVHKKVVQGDILTIWVEQTGGLTIKSKAVF